MATRSTSEEMLRIASPLRRKSRTASVSSEDGRMPAEPRAEERADVFDAPVFGLRMRIRASLEYWSAAMP